MPSKRSKHFATIYDVAKQSKVSIATVSRVLNKKDDLVTEKTRQRVLQVIKDLKFKPNLNARGLVGHQTNIIEIFFHISQFPVDFKSNWYNGILVGATHIIQKEKFGMMINFLVGIPDPQDIVQRVFHNNVDGILMISPSLEEKHLIELSAQSTPIVLVGHRVEDSDIAFVDGNNTEASEAIVKHLLDLGHRKIACLAGPIHNVQNARDRLTGFQNAMKQQGLTVPKNHILPSSGFIKGDGYEAMQKLLASSDRPTAVFATDDMLALGAWDAITNAGLKVGKDISLVGYDDIPDSSMEPYSLTTVRQDVQGLSSAGARLLIDKIKNPESSVPHQQFQPAQIIVRKSTGPVLK